MAESGMTTLTPIFCLSGFLATLTLFHHYSLPPSLSLSRSLSWAPLSFHFHMTPLLLCWSSIWFSHLWCAQIKCCGQISCCQTGLLGVAAWSQTMKGNLLVQFKVPFSKANLPYCSGGQQYRLWLNWPSPSSVWVCVYVSWMVERGLSLDRWRLERLETKLLHSGDFLTCHSRVNNTFSVLFLFKGSQTEDR